MSIVAIPIFIWQICENPDRFTALDIVLANVVILGILIGSILINIAFSLGQAGPLQALENLKTIWQVLLTIATQGIAPNYIEIIGCVLGLVGLAVIVLSKKPPPKVTPGDQESVQSPTDINHIELKQTEVKGSEIKSDQTR